MADEVQQVETPAQTEVQPTTSAEGTPEVGDVGLAAPVNPQTQEQPAEPVETAPEEYADFVDDQGVGFAAKDMPEFTGMARELGLSQEKAQKLLLTMVPTVKSKLNSSLNNVREQWKQAALSDKEYGGDAFRQNMVVANGAYAKFVTPELQKFMKQSGLSAHPDFIRMFYRIGKSMSQDTGVVGQGAPQPKRKLFPNSKLI